MCKGSVALLAMLNVTFDVSVNTVFQKKVFKIGVENCTWEKYHDYKPDAVDNFYNICCNRFLSRINCQVLSLHFTYCQIQYLMYAEQMKSRSISMKDAKHFIQLDSCVIIRQFSLYFTEQWSALLVFFNKVVLHGSSNYKRSFFNNSVPLHRSVVKIWHNLFKFSHQICF